MQEEASYVCASCGEEVVIPLDLSAGASQEYVEDCPVCCRPNVIHVELGEDSEARVWAEGAGSDALPSLSCLRRRRQNGMVSPT
ncbi:MAG: CPXCG motif-containing cysteine-rich protein [Planctomycetia bacterium]|nr:CPXCG motif-containing cysteine-rich protein [Planctomycetia bacterium]